MQTTISSILLQDAINRVKLAIKAKVKSHIEEEIRNSIGAHLILGITLEGIGNEFGELALDKWTWERLEKSDPPLKWKIISTKKEKGFKSGEEPLQTVQALQKIRNKIVHPKIEEHGEDIIVIRKNGKIFRNADGKGKIKDGDKIMKSYGKLYDEYNAKNALDKLKSTMNALITFRDHMKYNGFGWMDGLKKKVDTLKIN